MASVSHEETILTVIDRDDARLIQICANRWRENCFLLIDPRSRSCVVIDPGYGGETISREIRERALTVNAILVTHTHFDHVASVSILQQNFGNSPFLCHGDELDTLEDANIYTLCLNAGRITIPQPTRLLREGESIDFASASLNVFHMPGHTPGGCVFQYDRVLFTGDLLIESRGRRQKLPGFNREQLGASWRRVFSLFGDDCIVVPGHGSITTLGNERSRCSCQDSRAVSP